MSAMLLLLPVLFWTVVFLGTHAFLGIHACTNHYVSGLITSLPNETVSLGSGINMEFYRKNNTIVVEEVDKNGKSELKLLELPDYDVAGGLEEERTKHKEASLRPEIEGSKKDDYGCGTGRENQRRRCLQRRKKFLTKRYKNWKELIRRVIKDLDEKIKNLRSDCIREYRKGSANVTSGIPVRSVRRKKP